MSDEYDIPQFAEDPTNYALQEKSAASAGMGRNRNPPVRKVVEAQLVELKLQIKQREEFIAALDANVGVEDLLDKMRKLHL